MTMMPCERLLYAPIAPAQIPAGRMHMTTTFLRGKKRETRARFIRDTTTIYAPSGRYDRAYGPIADQR